MAELNNIRLLYGDFLSQNSENGVNRSLITGEVDSIVSCLIEFLDSFSLVTDLREIAGKPLSGPMQSAVDHQGTLWVVDEFEHLIHRIGPDNQSPATLGGQGSAEGQFRYPRGIAVSPDGEIFIVDAWNHRLQIFDTEGHYLRSIGSLYIATEEEKYTPKKFGGFNEPDSLCFDSRGRLLVTDSGNSRVVVLERDGSFIDCWGRRGRELEEFEFPKGLAVDSETMFVADWGNHRIQTFSLDGEFLQAIELNNKSRAYPRGLAVDGEGLIFVTDEINHDLLVFTPGGTNLLRTSVGPDGTGLQLPAGLSVGSPGEFWLADCLNHRLLHFKYKQLKLRKIMEALNRINPGDQAIIIQLARLRAEDGDLTGALELSDGLVQTFKQWDDFYLDYLHWLYKSNRLTQLRDVVGSILPWLKASIDNLAQERDQVRTKMDEIGLRYKEFQESVTANPNDDRMLYNRFSESLAIRQAQSQHKLLTRMLGQLNSQLAMAFHYSGMAMLAGNDEPAAFEQWRSALICDPENRVVQEYLIDMIAKPGSGKDETD
jgi:sugar lactone lactonase YvrE